MATYSQIVHHFDHPHPLDLVHMSPNNTNVANCPACEDKASGWIYKCSKQGKGCKSGFSIHADCAIIPENITLATHFKSNHTLKLMTTPPASGIQCDGGCNSYIYGYRYRCSSTSSCDFDLHIKCATRLSVTVQSTPSKPTQPSPGGNGQGGGNYSQILKTLQVGASALSTAHTLAAGGTFLVHKIQGNSGGGDDDDDDDDTGDNHDDDTGGDYDDDTGGGGDNGDFVSSLIDVLSSMF